MANISKIITPDGVSEYDIVAKYGRGIVRATMGSASTNKAFVATADGITELFDGLTISLRNTVVASASGCTLNLNNLGAKRIWNSLSNAYVTTQIALNTSYIFIYDAANNRWEWQTGYNTNTNTYVRQTLATGDTDRPILMAYSANDVTTTSVDNVAYRNNAIYANPGTGVITANGFNGPLMVGDVGDPLYPVYFADGIPEASSLRLRAFSNTATYLGKTYKTAFYIIASFLSPMDGYETMVFVVHTNYLNLEIPIYIPCAAVTGDSNNKQIFRGGWYQSGNNGGEASITIYRDLVNNRFVAQLDYCAVNGTERTGATVDVFCK